MVCSFHWIHRLPHVCTCVYIFTQRLKKVPMFKLCVTLSDLNRFSNYLHWWKAYKICYKTHLTLPTSPWEITNSNFLQIFSRYGRKSTQIEFLIAFNFASRSPYWLQIKFFNLLSFYLFTFVINLWHQKFVTSDVTAVFINNQHGIQRRGQDFDKTLLPISMGKSSLFWRPKISKFVDE